MSDLIIILSFAPALGLLYFFYKQDKNREEPKNVIMKVFFLGSLITIPAAIILELLLIYILFGKLSMPTEFTSLFEALKAAAIPGVVEEVLKLLAVLILAYKLKEFDERADGIVYAVIVGMGFAAFENIFYVLQNILSAFFRALTAVPMHAIVGAIMGFFIGRAKFSQKNKRKWLIFLGLILAIIIHTIYDFAIFASQNDDLLMVLTICIIILAMVVGILLSFKLMSILVKEDKKEFMLKKMNALASISKMVLPRGKNDPGG